jgi:(R,R)-butanediol dehydrogenase / meso-butanediol dehydrogenase / diacetyl reductase
MADFREAFEQTMGVDLTTGQKVDVKAVKAVIRS